MILKAGQVRLFNAALLMYGSFAILLAVTLIDSWFLNSVYFADKLNFDYITSKGFAVLFSVAFSLIAYVNGQTHYRSGEFSKNKAFVQLMNARWALRVVFYVLVLFNILMSIEAVSIREKNKHAQAIAKAEDHPAVKLALSEYDTAVKYADRVTGFVLDSSVPVSIAKKQEADRAKLRAKAAYDSVYAAHEQKAEAEIAQEVVGINHVGGATLGLLAVALGIVSGFFQLSYEHLRKIARAQQVDTMHGTFIPNKPGSFASRPQNAPEPESERESDSVSNADGEIDVQKIAASLGVNAPKKNASSQADRQLNNSKPAGEPIPVLQNSSLANLTEGEMLVMDEWMRLKKTASNTKATKAWYQHLYLRGYYDSMQALNLNTEVIAPFHKIPKSRYSTIRTWAHEAKKIADLGQNEIDAELYRLAKRFVLYPRMVSSG